MACHDIFLFDDVVGHAGSGCIFPVSRVAGPSLARQGKSRQLFRKQELGILSPKGCYPPGFAMPVHVLLRTVDVHDMFRSMHFVWSR